MGIRVELPIMIACRFLVSTSSASLLTVRLLPVSREPHQLPTLTILLLLQGLCTGQFFTWPLGSIFNIETLV